MPTLKFCFYQILTAFNKLKIMSKVAHGNWKRLKLFTCFIFVRGDSSLECFDWLWQSVPVIYSQFPFQHKDAVRFFFIPSCLYECLCLICVVCFIVHSGVLHDLSIWASWQVCYKRQELLTLRGAPWVHLQLFEGPMLLTWIRLFFFPPPKSEYFFQQH